MASATDAGGGAGGASIDTTGDTRATTIPADSAPVARPTVAAAAADAAVSATATLPAAAAVPRVPSGEAFWKAAGRFHRLR